MSVRTGISSRINSEIVCKFLHFVSGVVMGVGVDCIGDCVEVVEGVESGGGVKLMY